MVVAVRGRRRRAAGGAVGRRWLATVLAARGRWWVGGFAAALAAHGGRCSKLAGAAALSHVVESTRAGVNPA